MWILFNNKERSVLVFGPLYRAMGSQPMIGECRGFNTTWVFILDKDTEPPTHGSK